MKTSFFVVALSLAAAAPSLAHEEHRELGPHVHGQGTFNMAIEKKRVSIELEAPGMDIVGFEHEANSAEQKAAFAKAEKQLADPLSLFKVPESAGCKLADAKIAVEAEDEHEHADGKDDHDHDHADKKGDDHDEHGGHNSFHVTYAIDCANPANLTSITFDYFKTFAGAKKLEVSVVTDKAQNKFEVTSEKPVLDLAGAI